MKVKALCNIIYGGKMYGFGDIIETDKAISNTEPIETDDEQYNDSGGEPRVSEETDRDPRRARPARRGRGDSDERD